MLIFKNSLRKIKKSLGRFLSLIFIVMLGSAFFSGIRESSMDMIKTIDNYYDDTKLMDYKIISTYGLDDEDIHSIEKISNNLIVEPGYTFDILLDGKPSRIHSLTNVNKVNLISGKMPNKNECLAEDGTYKIGDKIIIESDYLNNKEYTVSGTITSSLYIYKSKGISTVGNGKLEKFIFIPKENFNMDYYTEIYIIDKTAVNETSYLNKYNNKINELDEKLKTLKPIRETIRYEETLKKATNKINEAEDEFLKEKTKNEKTLINVKKELDDNYNLLIQNKNKIKDAKNILEAKKIDLNKTFNDAKNKIETGKKQYYEVLKSRHIQEEDIPNIILNLDNKIKIIKEQIKFVNNENLQQQLQDKIIELEKVKKELILLKDTKTKLDIEEKTLNLNIAKFDKEYNDNKMNLISQENLINNNLVKLDDGYKEYKENYNKFQNRIKKAQEEIDNAKNEILKIEKPKWYLLKREDNSGYTNFYESAIKVDSIAKVFPIFFMIVVFLMSLNTMTRMIEEERSEIGVYVCLGINKFKIIMSYLFYVLIATSIGLFLGLTIGYTLIPHVLYSIYHANFIIPNLKTYVEIIPCLIIILITLLLMISVTLITVLKDFKSSPAELLRPIPPKNGKKVFLEKIDIIWKHLSFTWKVTIRNLFRYKKRIMMTVLGISGCTALLLTGFGIKDSVKSLVNVQYENIHLYDSMLFLKDEIKSNIKLEQDLKNKNIIPLYTKMENFNFEADNKKIDVYLMAFKDKSIDKYFNLETMDNKKINLTDDGVIITQKMAELLDAKVGKSISIRDSDNKLYLLKVNGICKNYVNSYIYISKEYYEKNFGEFKYNMIISNAKENQATELMDLGYFNNIQFTKDTLTVFKDIIKGMNNIVILIIISSTLLTIIVLYNLTTININERIREIATLKVLGFRDNEVSEYVYRETIILTIIGIILGMFLGITLNSFVLSIAETDEILFIKHINNTSYILTFLIMIFFTIVVEIITHYSLKKIDMIESLKSVE